jgi:hypothetical protein
MRKKYCDEESVFAHIWDNADRDGLWSGDAATVAAAFNVSADEAYASLSELCDRNRVERVGTTTYVITRWRERDDCTEEELSE